MEIIIIIGAIVLIYFLFVKESKPSPFDKVAVKKEIQSNLPDDILLKNLDQIYFFMNSL